MIETIKHKAAVVAIIISKDHHLEGDKIEFITPNEYSLQVGYMCRPTNYKVMPHTHNPVKRETVGTQEVLFIKEGRVRVDFYSFEQVYLESRELKSGDMVFLAGSGHGITVLEKATIVEVKNGPFIAGADKERFKGIDDK